MKPYYWYSDKPVGVNSLKKVVNNMMKNAGIEGCFTNHSLRVTTATRMFQKGVDKQLIKCVTGHKSDAVRLYKRPSDNLMKTACSAVVNPVTGTKSAVNKSGKTVEYNSEYVEKPEFNIDQYKIEEDSKVSYTTDQTDS